MSAATPKNIHLVAAARPNFMKVAPLWKALSRQDWCNPEIIHTGQHYDANMSEDFFQDLGLPQPHVHLGIGSGTHAEQTGRTLIAYEKLLLDERPDLVVVVGDVNATAAATLAAVKLGVKVAHLEAGLRSFDRTMPEEINRVITDALADLLWTPSPDADENLKHEGAMGRIVRVGNIMIDSLEMMRPKIEAANLSGELGLSSKSYGVLTLHRPANVDQKPVMDQICAQLIKVAEQLPLVFPVHPRTRKQLASFGLWNRLADAPGLRLLEPLSYIPFMSLLWQARLAITDSGGIQEETTYLGIPCLTLRPNTERPITITQGTNRLCRAEDLAATAQKALTGGITEARPIDMWDGHTAERVADSAKEILSWP
jgi:UDP-N-acetylglucosamine 2-epimerase (non-hydrolysing)